MAWIIGTDEAGYGPNLGPLVIAATLWHCDTWTTIDLANELDPLKSADNGGLKIADSKQVYSSATGFAELEKTVYAFLARADLRPDRWLEMLHAFWSESIDELGALPWYHDLDYELPLELDPEVRAQAETRLDQFFGQANVDFRGVDVRAIEPDAFNSGCIRSGNKASLLTESTLELVRSHLRACEPQPTLVLCDKHGGRNKYLPALQTCFPDSLVRVVKESAEISCYRTGVAEAEIEFRFMVKGERFFPVALSSMIAKYLRELSMKGVNQFWTGQVPMLKPTAGYPVDAKRFRQEIAARATELSIEPRLYWREK
jgi:ribonuclease HII